MEARDLVASPPRDTPDTPPKEVLIDGRAIEAQDVEWILRYDQHVREKSEIILPESASTDTAPESLSIEGAAYISPHDLADHSEIGIAEPDKIKAVRRPNFVSPKRISVERAKVPPTPRIEIQDYESKADSTPQAMSRDVLQTRPDYYSAYDVSPQPDGGAGMVALAATYVEREKARRAKNTDQAQESSVVWAYSQNGLDVRDFLASISECDAAILTNTEIHLVCDSEIQKAALEKSRLLDKWQVTINVIDPTDSSSITMPRNTRIAIMSEVLDKLPTHQMFKSTIDNQLHEILETISIPSNHPILSVDTQAGHINISDPQALRINETVYGDELGAMCPQVYSDIQPENITANLIDSTTLKTRKHSTSAFIATQNEALRDNGVVFDYAPTLQPLVEAVTNGMTPDGILYIKGPLRKDKWIHPDKLQTSEGPVVSSVIEEAAIYNAAQSCNIAPEGVFVSPHATGENAYVLIDRTADTSQSIKSHELFNEAISNPQHEAIEAAVATLESKLTSLTVADKTQLGEHSRKVQEAYEALVGLYPQASRDHSLALSLARTCCAAEAYDQAYSFAERAQRAAPNLSAGYVEMARAESKRNPDNYSRTKILLDIARERGRENPAIYEVAIEYLDSNPTIKSNLLPDYIEAAGEFLKYGVDLDTDRIIDTLISITQALQEDLSTPEPSIETAEGRKTIIIENIATGKRRQHHIPIGVLKRIKAADAALANAEAVGSLRNYQEVDYEELLACQAELYTIWQAVVPRDFDDLPLPRDEWADNNPSRLERWIYNGSIYESDAAATPPLNDLRHSKDNEVLDTEIVIGADEEYAVETPETMSIGIQLDDLGNEHGGSPFLITKEDLVGHLFITGQTRKGKTTLLKKMFEQLPDMDVNFWAFDLGNKSELALQAEHLKAKGKPVIVIAPGDKNSIPISVDILKPVEGTNIDEHIGKFVEAWITAYGGGGESPVGQILKSALREIYAANGWSVVPGDNEAITVAVSEHPTVPTLDELLAACGRHSAEYSKGTDASNLPTYFKKRINAMQQGSFGEFLAGDNSIDWAKLNKSNIIWDFSRITSPDERRFLFTALTMQASNYLQFHEGLSDEVKTVWAIDEASLIAKDGSDSDHSRKHSVELFAERQKVLGGYGVSIWNTVQSTIGVHNDLLSQSSMTIALPMRDPTDKRNIITSMNVSSEEPLYDPLFHRLSESDRGTALVWKSGTKKPTVIRVTPAAPPSQTELARGNELRVELPIIPNPYDRYTESQRDEAKIAAIHSAQAWKRIHIGSITLAHTSHTHLPKSVPEQLQHQWKHDIATDSEQARLVIYYMAKQAVRERAKAVRSVYDPAELLASVVAHTLSSLNNQATSSYASPRFGLPEVREALSYKKLRNPLYASSVPRDEQFVAPLPYRLDQPVPIESVRRRSNAKPVFTRTIDQIGELESHHLSPIVHSTDRAMKMRNIERAYIATAGNNRAGAPFWQAVRLATGHEPDPIRQRRAIAKSLGYISSAFSAEVSDFETVLALQSDLYQQLQAA